MIPNKVMSDLNVLCSGVMNLIFGEIYSICIITQQMHLANLQSKIFQLLFDPKNLCTTTMYSTSVVDKATQACFLLCQDIRLEPSRWQVLLVLFLSNLHLAKSESEYPTKCIRQCEGYHKATNFVPFRYFKILLAALKWDSLGLDWNLAQR